MEFNEFAKQLEEGVAARLSEEENYSVSLREVTKNNNTILPALEIKDSSVGVVIYIDEYYDHYKEGGSTIAGIVEWIYASYKNHRNNMPSLESIGDITDFDMVKDRVIIQLISAKENLGKLDEYVAKAYLDLAVMFRVVVENNENGIGSFMVSWDLFENWKIGIGELYEIALSNTKRILKPFITPMDGVIPKELQGDIMPPGLFVLMNEKGVNGASGILYKDILKELADEEGCDLYIVLSSIHEAIVWGKKFFDMSGFSDTVKLINQTELDPTEQLSDHVYYYSRRSDDIFIIE